MESKAILRGIANVSYWSDDVKKARSRYTGVFGMEPYFQKPDPENPAYIEYRVGDYQQEVGIIDQSYRPKPANEDPGGSILYWHVDDVQKAFQQLISMGASAYESITERGEGFITAAVIDPFGNILGDYAQSHYLKMMSQIKRN